MKHVVFKKLIIQNFFSVGDTPVEITFEPGMHIITGDNKDRLDRKNGVGKSTIADAFYFAIFGKTIRDITKKELIANNLTNGVCAVSLSFDIHSSSDKGRYSISRQLKPSKLILEKDGVDITRDSIINTTDYILDVLDASSEIFKNCVVMTANNTVPFMGQKSVSKRKFIENIFSLEAFGEMLKLARNDYNEIKRDYELDLTRLEEKTNSLNNYNTQRDNTLQERSNKLISYKTRLTNNKKSIKELVARLERIQQLDPKPLEDKNIEILDGIEQVERKIRDQLEVCASLRTEIKRDEEDYDDIGTEKDKCPTCLREIKDHDRDCIEESKAQMQAGIDKKRGSLAVCVSAIEKLDNVKIQLVALRKKTQDKIDSIKIEINSIDSINESIAQFDEWIKSLEVDIQNLKSKNTDLDSLIVEATSGINMVKAAAEKNRGMLNIIDYGKFIVSEEGVKAYIVKQILQLFNSRLAYYLKKMDANCICMFNEYFEEEIINDNNKLCSYYNFSDGERKNIDLACLFTFADARRMQGNVAYNVSFFDELYDSSLDSKGVELVNQILQDRVENNKECVFIITHRPEAIKSITDSANIIYLKKENGITTRVDDVAI
jgi:DNA repair exonuclease SbcCD ATPase subunit